MGPPSTSCVPGLDLTWFQHFAKAFGIEQYQVASDNPNAPKASMFVAFEHVLKDVVVKAYFLPSLAAGLGGPLTFETFGSAARKVLTNAAALNAALDYVKNNVMGIDLIPDMRAVDCIDATKSRLKLYVSSTATSFVSIVSVRTLGGKISDMDRGIKELGPLLSLILGRETLISWDDELEVQGVFDKCLTPSSELPDLKLYIPVIRFGRSNAAVASGFGPKLRLRQRDQFHDGFTYLAVAFQRD
ncbi:aromatic prenyltransferase [Fusarium circinatum]|uniref:Aromatic prenyltransferase n=1 Tax=Fusarium circinatum TaxID=48490 RepID=A0A8H5TNZ1_FUSCI|nr:aromatic prenyltransferase [Fusarium circinatum]